MKSEALLGVGLAFAMSACGDDAVTPPADSRMVDAPAPDAPPGVGFFSDEGGEVRFEYIHYEGTIAGGGNPVVTSITRVISFFEANDDTDFHMYPMIPGCTIVSDDMRWPTSQPSNRTYVDVGQLTLTNGNKLLNVPKSTLATDPAARTHGVGNWYEHSVLDGTPGSAIGDGPTYWDSKTSYDVIFTGSPTWPPQIYKDAIYTPADYTLIGPNPTGTAPLMLAADTPITFTWNAVDSMNPTTVPEDWYAVGFLAPNAGFVVLCVEPMNDGSMTVPADMINAVRTAAPSGGLMVRQSFHHQVRELTNGTTVKNRRIDMLGVWCFAGDFAVN